MSALIDVAVYRDERDGGMFRARVMLRQDDGGMTGTVIYADTIAQALERASRLIAEPDRGRERLRDLFGMDRNTAISRRLESMIEDASAS